jgi:Na+/phosphate symporter
VAEQTGATWLAQPTRGDKVIIYLSVLIALIGLLMYALCVNGKLQEIGRIAFGCGLLAFLIRVTGDMISVVK